VATTGAISRAKLQSQSNYHHQQTNTQFFLQAGNLSCNPTTSVTERTTVMIMISIIIKIIMKKKRSEEMLTMCAGCSKNEPKFFRSAAD